MDAATGEMAAGTLGDHYRVVHALRRRLRVSTPVVHKDQERAYLLEILLTKHPSIARVRAVPEIGSVAVCYDPTRITAVSLLTLLDRVLGNLTSRLGATGRTQLEPPAAGSGETCPAGA